MKNIFRMLLLVTSFNSFALDFNSFALDFSGNVGYTSDYVWRGVSQGNQPALSYGFDVSSDAGFYLGVWSSDVEFDDATEETDFYGGWAFALSDSMSVDVGYIRYTYDGTVDSFQELYASVSYNDLSLSYYQDINTNDNYAEIGYNLWFVPVVDVTLIGGLYDDGETFGQLNVGYSFNDNFSINAIIDQDVFDVFEGQASDNVSIGINYVF